MKIAVIAYHKNIGQYPKEWIDAFRNSVLNQTYKNFDILEMDYGEDGNKIFEHSIANNSFFNIKQENFAEAMNFLIDWAFNHLKLDYVLNTNVDDIYSLNRIERQYPYMLMNYDVISSNFSLVRDDRVVHTHYFDKLDIKTELDRNHNIICHPVIAISRRFWEKNRYIPEQIPTEDMQLWQRGLERGYKFIIVPEVLVFHRLHNSSVGHKQGEI